MFRLPRARTGATKAYLLTASCALIAASPAPAAIVSLAPPTNPNSQQVAANDPGQGNVWTGIAQSVTAADEHVRFGFYLFGQEQSEVLYSLYAGDGIFSNPLKQVLVNSPAGSGSGTEAALVSADFSDVQLTIGAVYTFRMSLPGEGLPADGAYSTANAAYAGLSNPYAGGRFWFSGANYSQSSPAFADRDLAFEMVGIVAPIPEPASWALMIAGFGLAGAAARRRSVRVASA